MREHWQGKSAQSGFDIAKGKYTYFSRLKTPSKEESETGDMRISPVNGFKTVRKIGSIAIRVAVFYVLFWSTVLFSFLIAEAITGYTYPDNPVKSDYPTPVLFDVLVFFSPYVLWLLAVTAYDLVKNIRKSKNIKIRKSIRGSRDDYSTCAEHRSGREIAAIETLGDLQLNNAVPALIEALYEHNKSIRECAAIALAKVQSAEAKAALEEYQKKEKELKERRVLKKVANGKQR